MPFVKLYALLRLTKTNKVVFGMFGFGNILRGAYLI